MECPVLAAIHGAGDRVLELPVNSSRLRFTLRISYPLMLAGALAPARQFHYRLCEAARTAKTDPELRHGLLAWLNSLNEMNCPWYEYPLRHEVAHQLHIQGIRPWSFIPASGGRVPPPRIIDNAVALLIDCALDGIHDVLATARRDEMFRLKLILWTKIMTLGTSWANRWVAGEIKKHVEMHELDHRWLRTALRVCGFRVITALIGIHNFSRRISPRTRPINTP